MSRLKAHNFLQLLSIICLTIGAYCEDETNDDDNAGMSLIGLALEAFNPCPDGFIYMEREIGRRPSEENYWTGTVNLDNYKGLTEARIELILDNPAVMSIDPEIARINAEGTTFKITPFSVNDTIKFDVKAPQGKPFPNIVKARLNGMRVCRNSTKFQPTILGAQPLASGSFTVAPRDFIPYCGRPQIEHNALIIRGKETKYGDYPWHAAIFAYDTQRKSQTYICGGTLLSNEAVLTAGHCVTINGAIRSTETLVVTLGKYSLIGNDAGAQERQVSSIRLHENYDYTTLRNDIAIIKLKTQVEYTQYIQPICLWPEDRINKNDMYGKEATIVGWGLNENDTLAQELLAANITIVSDVECLLSFASFFQRFVNNNTLCAGNGKLGGPTPCNGDSGGGMVVPIIQADGKASYFLRGLVSVSVSRANQALCNPEHYVVFTDTAQYLQWIDKNK